jgi:hypothetical protein
MEIYPSITIHFPESKEVDLIDAMKTRATSPWRWEEDNGLPGDPGDERYVLFCRDAVGTEPPYQVWMYHNTPGELVLVNIFAVGKQGSTPRDQNTAVLEEFEKLIAEPAAARVGGLASIEAQTRRPLDYFSPRAVQHLECFCTTSNVSTLGSHPSDQRKWVAFLLQTYRDQVANKAGVDCDTLGECLRAKGWWPEVDIPRLVQEYDLGMVLLRAYERTRARS